MATIFITLSFLHSLYDFCFFFLQNLSKNSLLRSPKKNNPVTQALPNLMHLITFNLANNKLSEKRNDRAQTWWHMPVIPATQEAEAGESIEPGGRGLQWAKIVPLYSSVGKRARLCLKKEKTGRPRRVDHEVKGSRPSWSTWWNPVYTKNTKNGGACL